MYPDTDMPPIAVTADRIARLNRQLPERVWDRVAFARENGVPVGLASLTAVSPRWAVFREAVEAGVKATRAASLPSRITSVEERAPANRAREPSTMDLPAPVSPVSTFSPGPNSNSPRVRMATFSIRSVSINAPPSAAWLA